MMSAAWGYRECAVPAPLAHTLNAVWEARSAATRLILLEQGVKVGEARDMVDWGIRTLHVRDPDGNFLELFEHLDKARWSDRLRSEDTRSRR